MTDAAQADENTPETKLFSDERDASAFDHTMSPEETETFIDAYQITAEWIRFADAKAAAVLTVCGALAGLLIPTLKPFVDEPTYSRRGGTNWELGYSWPGCSFCSPPACPHFSVFSGFVSHGKHQPSDTASRFHPAAMAKYDITDGKRFVRDCEAIGTSGFAREVLAGLR